MISGCNWRRLETRDNRHLYFVENWHYLASTYNFVTPSTVGRYVSIGDFHGIAISNYELNFKETPVTLSRYMRSLNTVWLIYSLPLTGIRCSYTTRRNIFVLYNENDVRQYMVWSLYIIISKRRILLSIFKKFFSYFISKTSLHEMYFWKIIQGLYKNSLLFPSIKNAPKKNAKIIFGHIYFNTFIQCILLYFDLKAYFERTIAHTVI